MPHKFARSDLDALARRPSLQSPKIASVRWSIVGDYTVALDVTAVNGASKTFRVSFDDRSLVHEDFMDWLGRHLDAEVEAWIASQPVPALRGQVGGSHYKDMAIQPVQFIHANGLDYLTGNVIKYVCRHKAKNGVQDLLKARHYLDLLLELEYGFSASSSDAAQSGAAETLPGQPPGGAGTPGARRP